MFENKKCRIDKNLRWWLIDNGKIWNLFVYVLSLAAVSDLVCCLSTDNTKSAAQVKFVIQEAIDKEQEIEVSYSSHDAAIRELSV